MVGSTPTDPTRPGATTTGGDDPLPREEREQAGEGGDNENLELELGRHGLLPSHLNDTSRRPPSRPVHLGARPRVSQVYPWTPYRALPLKVPSQIPQDMGLEDPLNDLTALSLLN